MLESGISVTSEQQYYIMSHMLFPYANEIEWYVFVQVT